jgi:hypothetical protein
MDKVLFNFTDEILYALSNKMHVCGTACDLAQALDCTNHEILPPKLNFYGIRGMAGQFKSYFHSRK